MAYTAIAQQTVAGPYAAESITAKMTTITFTAADITNGNEIIMATGRTLLLCRNDDVGAVTVTVASSPDPYGRTATITAFSIAAGATVGRIFEVVGWESTGGGRNLVVTASDVDLKIAAIAL